MKWLLPLVLLASCSPKTYTEPAVGMPSYEFDRLCPSPDDFQRTETANENKWVLTFNQSNYRGEKHPAMCVGQFTFINGTLQTISR